MSHSLNPRIGRRALILAATAGGAAAATLTILHAPAEADSESSADKLKARYQADSPEVQTFYRVNRYPPGK